MQPGGSVQLSAVCPFYSVHWKVLYWRLYNEESVSHKVKKSLTLMIRVVYNAPRSVAVNPYCDVVHICAKPLTVLRVVGCKMTGSMADLVL